MKFDSTLAGFQSALGDMATAQGKIQAGFARALDRDNPPSQQESTEFTQAFVEEDFAARLAEAQLKILKSQDEMLGTVLNLKDESKS